MKVADEEERCWLELLNAPASVAMLGEMVAEATGKGNRMIRNIVEVTDCTLAVCEMSKAEATVQLRVSDGQLVITARDIDRVTDGEARITVPLGDFLVALDVVTGKSKKLAHLLSETPSQESVDNLREGMEQYRESVEKMSKVVEG